MKKGTLLALIRVAHAKDRRVRHVRQEDRVGSPRWGVPPGSGPGGLTQGKRKRTGDPGDI